MSEFLEAFPEPAQKAWVPSDSVFPPSIKPAPVGILTKDNRHGGLEDWMKAAYYRIREDKTFAGPLRQYAKEWYETGHTPQKRNWEHEVDEMCDWFERRQWGGVVSR